MSMATGMTMGNRLTGNMQGDIIPKGYRKGQLSQFTPEQTQLFQSLFSNLGSDSFLGKLASGDQSQFDQLEAPALQQFTGLQGNLASRFSNMGTGARRSSGFTNTMNQASSDFAQSLQSQRMGLQQQAIRDLMGMSNQLLQQRPYDQFLTEKQQPFWKKLLGSLAGPAVQGAFTSYGMSQMNKPSSGGSASGGGMDMAKMMPYLMAFI